MVRTIELPEEVDRSLVARAERDGVTVEALTVDILKGAVSTESSLPKPGSMTPAQIVEYWKREGLIGWRTDVEDSAAYAREIREKAQRRER